MNKFDGYFDTVYIEHLWNTHRSDLDNAFAGPHYINGVIPDFDFKYSLHDIRPPSDLQIFCFLNLNSKSKND